MKKTIYLIIIALILFASGFVNYIHLQNIIIENLNNYSFTYEVMNTQLFDSLKFGILCGITPIILNIFWNKTKTEKLKVKLLSFFVFLISSIGYVFIRISILNSKTQIENLGMKNSLSFESLNLPLHLFLAQLIGLLIVYVLLKSKTK